MKNLLQPSILEADAKPNSSRHTTLLLGATLLLALSVPSVTLAGTSVNKPIHIKGGGLIVPGTDMDIVRNGEVYDITRDKDGNVTGGFQVSIVVQVVTADFGFAVNGYFIADALDVKYYGKDSNGNRMACTQGIITEGFANILFKSPLTDMNDEGEFGLNLFLSQNDNLVLDQGVPDGDHVIVYWKDNKKNSANLFDAPLDARAGFNFGDVNATTCPDILPGNIIFNETLRGNIEISKGKGAHDNDDSSSN